MSGTYIALIACDRCGATHPTGYRYLTDARASATRAGWQRRWNANRTKADICPSCVAKEAR